MAAATGVSRAKVHVIWREAGLVPHRWRRFKLSNDPAFAEKVEDVQGVYVDPPEHAVLLSIDEKSPIQALDRTQPGLPIKRGRLGTMTHDYKRNGTTTLFAAINTLDGTVIGRNMQRHRHQDFIRFLNSASADARLPGACGRGSRRRAMGRGRPRPGRSSCFHRRSPSARWRGSMNRFNRRAYPVEC
jgi:hypothetical protein